MPENNETIGNYSRSGERAERFEQKKEAVSAAKEILVKELSILGAEIDRMNADLNEGRILPEDMAAFMKKFKIFDEAYSRAYATFVQHHQHEEILEKIIAQTKRNRDSVDKFLRNFESDQKH